MKRRWSKSKYLFPQTMHLEETPSGFGLSPLAMRNLWCETFRPSFMDLVMVIGWVRNQKVMSSYSMELSNAVVTAPTGYTRSLTVKVLKS